VERKNPDELRRGWRGEVPWPIDCGKGKKRSRHVLFTRWGKKGGGKYRNLTGGRINDFRKGGGFAPEGGGESSPFRILGDQRRGGRRFEPSPKGMKEVWVWQRMRRGKRKIKLPYNTNEMKKRKEGNTVWLYLRKKKGHVYQRIVSNRRQIGKKTDSGEIKGRKE